MKNYRTVKYNQLSCVAHALISKLASKKILRDSGRRCFYCVEMNKLVAVATYDLNNNFVKFLIIPWNFSYL